MNGLARSSGVGLFGIISSVLTAIFIVVISKMTGFDFFTLSVWVVIPVGAIITGLAAASGYYFGSLYFHKRPDIPLLCQMVVIAGLTQLLIYYLGYYTFVLDDGRRVADLMPFQQYLDVVLTSAHYKMRGTIDSGSVGTFGYWLAFFQFVGFLVGGLCVYGYLLQKPICSKCKLYLRPLSKREKAFVNMEAAASYYDALFSHPVDGPDFAELIRSRAYVSAKKGAVLVKTILHGCAQCKSQVIEERVQINNGREWSNLAKFDRRVAIPEGVDLLNVFRS